MALYDLKSAIGKVGGSPKGFSFFKGKKKDTIFLSGGAPSKAQHEEMEKLCGEVTLSFRGVCYNDGEDLVFATRAAPSSSWKGMILKALSDQKCARPFALRQMKPEETKQPGTTDGTENGSDAPTENSTASVETPTENASSKPDVNEMRFHARFDALEPEMLSALKEQRGDAGKMRAVVGFAQSKAQEGNYPSALAALDALEKLLGASGADAAEKPTTEADPMPAFKARFQAIVPKLKTAIAAGNPGADDQRLLASQANVFANKKDFAQANAMLDRIDGWLGKSGVQPTPTVTASTPTPTPQTDTAPDADEAEIDAEAAAKPGSTLVIWRTAREIVGRQLGQLQAKLRGTGDPDFARIADVGLNGITKRLQVGMQVALMNFDGAQGADRDKARTKVRTAVGDFRKFLNSNRMVPVIEENPFGAPVTLSATMGKALNKILQLIAQ